MHVCVYMYAQVHIRTYTMIHDHEQLKALYHVYFVFLNPKLRREEKRERRTEEKTGK